MTQIGGVFSFPSAGGNRGDGKHTRLPEPRQEIPRCRASYRRYPSALTSEIKINGAAEGFFYVLQ